MDLSRLHGLLWKKRRKLKICETEKIKERENNNKARGDRGNTSRFPPISSHLIMPFRLSIANKISLKLNPICNCSGTKLLIRCGFTKASKFQTCYYFLARIINGLAKAISLENRHFGAKVFLLLRVFCLAWCKDTQRSLPKSHREIIL